MSIGFSTKTYVFDPRPTYPLVSVAKRYWRPESPYLNDTDALTLVFAHGTSFHKEAWEPVIDDLQALLDKSSGCGRTKIREIWTLDASNHGEAAALNAETLKLGYEHIFGWEEYARSIHLFLSGLGKGVDVDFSGHNLVGIGHSMGAVSLALARGYYPKVKLTSFIMCELMIMPRIYGAASADMLSGGAVKRRDIWPSKEEAYKLLKERGTWKSWDDRTLRLYVASQDLRQPTNVQHGLCALPTLEYPDKTEGVTLSCNRIQEAACYRDSLGPQRLYANFGNLVKEVPAHLIYGGVDDYIPAEVKKDIVESRAGGLQNLASFARVPKAGHLVVQMNPTGLAEKICDALVIVSQGLKSSVVEARL